MKIQSGRIRQIGLNQNNGMSLGFAGLGDCTNGYDEFGVACQDFSPITSALPPTPNPFAGSVATAGSPTPTSATPTATSSLTTYLPLLAGALLFILLVKK